jgi:hypothetical protein
MMFWMNDKQKQYEQNIGMLKYGIPIFVFSIIAFSIILIWKISLLQLLVITTTWTLCVYTIINIFVQTPHVQIPNSYPFWLKTLLYKYRGQVIMITFLEAFLFML